MKASTVVTPTSPMVHGRAEKTTWETWSGKKVSDRPQCPVKVLAR